MATSNFHYKNMCVAVGIGSDELDDFTLETSIEFWGKILENKVDGFVADQGVVWVDKNSRSIGEVSAYDRDGAYVGSVRVVLNPGYYQGACLDYVIEDEGAESGALEGDADDIIDTAVDQIKKILPTFGMQLRRVATFSNGETIYQPVSKK